MNYAKISPELMTAKQANSKFGVSRLWLRQMYEEGKLTRKAIKGRDYAGEPNVAYLYSAKEIKDLINEQTREINETEHENY